MRKVIVRIKGGLGNQLFCYAAARRLAFINNAELVIDHVTGFTNDHLYKRKYELDNFLIPIRKVTSFELFWCCNRYWLNFLKLISFNKIGNYCWYIEEESMAFDERLLKFNVNKAVYIEGYWQSENYFKDIEQLIRSDLFLSYSLNEENQKIANDISKSLSSVAIHVRWFDAPENSGDHTISLDYYSRAIAFMEQKLDSPHYFIFSDNPDAVNLDFTISEDRVTLISNQNRPHSAYNDICLMSQCKHFIIANSTFSWWAAWLGKDSSKIVLTPDIHLEGKAAWGFNGLIPREWIKV